MPVSTQPLVKPDGLVELRCVYKRMWNDEDDAAANIYSFNP